MAANQRKQFVQARLKALGAEGTPEQKAKLRERFNTLSQTKEGRTKIAQVVLPSGTASERAALKKALRPPSKNKPTSTATSTTTSTTGVVGGVNTPTGSSASSAVVPGAKITPPTTVPTSTTVPRSTTSTTSTTVPAAQKSNNSGPRIVNFEPKGIPTVKVTKVRDNKNVYGDTFEEKIASTLEKYKVPILGRVAGIGRSIDAGKNKQAALGLAKAVGLAAVSSLLPKAFQTNVTAIKTIRSIKNQKSSQKVQPFDPSKMRAALESYKGTPTKSSKISGANKPTSMPKVPDFKAADPKTGRYKNLFE